MGLFSLLVFAGTAVAVLFTVIGLATDHWLEAKHADSHSGLWRSCFGDDCSKIPTGAKCDSESGIPACDRTAEGCGPCEKLNTVRAATLLAMIFGFFALLISAKSVFGGGASAMMHQLYSGLMLFSGVWLLIGVSIFVDEFGEADGDQRYDWSFALVCVALVLFWLAPVLGWFAKDRE